MNKILTARVLAGLAAAAFCPGLLRASEVVTHPFCGITVITRMETLPRNLVMHVVQIDLKAPGLRFKLTPPGGTRDTVRQTTLEFLRQQKAQLAINAHFYLPFTTPELDANLVGFAASEGNVYSPFEPQPIGPGWGDQSFAILPYAPALNIDRSNHARIIHHDPAFPDHRHVLEPVTFWTAVSGSAQIVRDGVKTIPTYTGAPDGLNRSVTYSDQNSWYAALRARTVIGLTLDNQTLLIFSVDEVAGSAGMTVAEVADLLMHDYQIQNALNLDGDGSTSVAIEDPLTRIARWLNVPSDGVTGRGVGSNLAVFAQPRQEASTRLTLTLAANNSVIASWPADSEEWELQRTSTLSPQNWLRVHAQPRRVGDCMQVVVPQGNSGRFYRLVR